MGKSAEKIRITALAATGTDVTPSVTAR